MGDAGIVRNRAKIEAAIANARATVALREAEGLAPLAWSFAPEPGRAAPGTLAELPAATPESTALAKALKARGFRFVGPTTAYALMQACGLVNDHVARLLRAGRGRAGAGTSAGGGTGRVNWHGSASKPAQSGSHTAQIPR